MSRRSQRIKEMTADAHTDTNTLITLPKQTKPSEAVARGKGNRRRAQAAAKAPLYTTETKSTSVEAKVSSEKVNRAPRRRGKLHQILDMPLDVIMEICLHLETRDMLHLSRLSKAFRAMFTSRSTQFIWKAARLNVVGLPPCPADLTELAYANLLFDPYCHNCMSKNCYNVYWGCRVRLCKSCFEDEELNLPPHVYNSSEYRLYNELTARILHRPERVNSLTPPLHQLPNGIWTHYRPALDKIIIAWKETPPIKEQRIKYLADHRRTTAAIIETVPALTAWYNNYRSSRANELLDVRKSRRDAILKKLKEDGWEPELEYLANTSPDDNKKFNNLPEVRKTQALTPRIWNSIKARITEFMQELREKRLWEIYMDTLTSRLHSVNDIMPKVISEIPDCNLTPRELVFRSRALRDIIDPENKDFNAKDEETRQRFHALVIEYLAEREREGRQALAAMIREETGLKKSTDPFSLAIGSLFTCSTCRSVFTYHQAIAHVCPYNTRRLPPKPEWMTVDYFNAAATHAWWMGRPVGAGEQLVWSMEVFRPQCKNVAAVIEACGFKINKATVEDLDMDEDLRVVCTSHLEKQKYIPVMRWRAAAHGNTCCRHEKFDPTYELASEEYKAAVKASEEEHAAKTRAEWLTYHRYQSARCNKFSKGEPYAVVAAHLKDKHGIAEPAEGDIHEQSTRFEMVSPVYLVSYRCEGKNHALHYLEKASYGGKTDAHRITYWKIK